MLKPERRVGNGPSTFLSGSRRDFGLLPSQAMILLNGRRVKSAMAKRSRQAKLYFVDLRCSSGSASRPDHRLRFRHDFPGEGG